MGLAGKATFPAAVLQEDYNRQIASVNEEKCYLVICAQILSSAHSAASKGQKNWPRCAPGFGVRATGARLAERASVLEPSTHAHSRLSLMGKCTQHSSWLGTQARVPEGE